MRLSSLDSCRYLKHRMHTSTGCPKTEAPHCYELLTFIYESFSFLTLLIKKMASVDLNAVLIHLYCQIILFYQFELYQGRKTYQHGQVNK